MSINPYRPKIVDAFDRVVHYSIALLAERRAAGERHVGKGVETSGSGAEKDFMASFLEAQGSHSGAIQDENIVMYILTNVKKSPRTGRGREQEP